jgi:hypothetical protein
MIQFPLRHEKVSLPVKFLAISVNGLFSHYASAKLRSTVIARRMDSSKLGDGKSNIIWILTNTHRQAALTGDVA